MARDSRGRYTVRLVGSGRRLRMAGAVFDGPEVGGVVTGQPVTIGPIATPAEAREAEDTKPARTSRSR